MPQRSSPVRSGHQRRSGSKVHVRVAVAVPVAVGVCVAVAVCVCVCVPVAVCVAVCVGVGVFGHHIATSDGSGDPSRDVNVKLLKPASVPVVIVQRVPVSPLVLMLVKFWS